MYKTPPLAVAVSAALMSLYPSVSSAQGAGESGMLEEVIVTAQRRAESLQEVPMTVTAITPQDIADYNLFRFEDLAQLSPGLSLESNGGFGSVAQMRGVGFDSNASAAPAVDVYINETPVDANYAFQSIYDIGQVEVLRGPQGTLRGRPAPGGAITVTTRRPDLDAFGGSLSASAGDQGSQNYQGALNVPLIDNQLGLRVAGMFDEDEGNRAKSVNSGIESERETRSWRASLLWAPTDGFEALLTHQWLESDRINMETVNGPGAGYNGPAIGDDRDLSVMEGESGGKQKFQTTTLHMSLDLPGHVLYYNGAYQDNSFDFDVELDLLNAALDWTEAQKTRSSFKVDSQELRLESDNPDAFADYLVGLWYMKTDTATTFAQPSVLDGAFGSPLNPDPTGGVNSDYLIQASGGIPIEMTEYAIYSNTTLHLTDATDLQLGVRYLQSEEERVETINTSAAEIAIGIAPGAPLNGLCQGLVGLGVGFNGDETYPGYCDLVLASSNYSQTASKDQEAWVYNVALKHQFTDDVMAYFNYGHSWRPAGVTVGVTAPVTPDLLQGDPEESDSYEIGVRSELFDRRMRLNASIFHQSFDNFIGRFNEVPYIGAGDTIQSGGFTYPGDATVEGFELDVSYSLTENWWAQFNTAYADGTYDDATVPCRDTNLDGNPDSGDIGDLTLDDFGGSSVLYCDVDTRISSTPKWTAMLQTEYSFELFSNDAYVRALYNYYSEQEDTGMDYEADAYGILNVFAGIRGVNSPWEISVWAKNLLDEDTLLERGQPQTVYGMFPAGYYQVRYVPEREVGITLRYAFGNG
ncbi:TonB-dependent receptor [Parahaliea aestuarii]|uniref:TonB-dependent receptor plug domain-containing protein n=1 Tax=Parahaliea aestuarii TaxID=1852021 RepID=A0A5C8ZS25_9GAMM|nr:TonB-dependent receptor [Parahaliea aestuarii]TXS91185.1 TonB-dependent receptor plug domain-containing protein [Parahaliea aestuarii]